MTHELKEELEHPNRKGALLVLPVLQVLLTLRFYVNGSFQHICAELIRNVLPHKLIFTRGGLCSD